MRILDQMDGDILMVAGVPAVFVGTKSQHGDMRGFRLMELFITNTVSLIPPWH